MLKQRRLSRRKDKAENNEDVSIEMPERNTLFVEPGKELNGIGHEAGIYSLRCSTYRTHSFFIFLVLWIKWMGAEACSSRLFQHSSSLLLVIVYSSSSY